MQRSLLTLGVKVTVTCALLFSSAAMAQPRGYMVDYSSGTGFFVSKKGGVVTNHHVIQTCDKNSIQVRNDKLDWVNARYVSSDITHDLALLQANTHAPRVAIILADSNQIRQGESVVVMGYPGEHSRTGKYRFEKSEITGFEGPAGETHWYQFRNVVQQGNSGGPLLDQAGNVIGVIMGFAERYQVNQMNKAKTFMGSSGLAITLPILQKFLQKNGVRYARAPSYNNRTDNVVEHNARDFIVNIRCVSGKTAL